MCLSCCKNCKNNLVEIIFDPDDSNEDFCEGKSPEKFDLVLQADNWMSMIPDKARLTELSIPGTHDSMALEGPAEGFFGGSDMAGDIFILGNKLAICQSMELNTQLEQGIRFFDMRLHYQEDQEDFRMCHGAVLQSTSFGPDVLAVIDDFLKR